MHIHLDPVGGAAGDMFAAAILDLRPDLAPGLQQALSDAGFLSIVKVAHRPFSDGILTGSQFDVVPVEPQRHDDLHSDSDHHGHSHSHSHRHYPDVVKLFEDANMDANVRARALDIFRILGEAEAHVHGKTLAEVAFHEVGAWDSIADVMSAAWLIDALGAQSWSCAAIPIGGGRVQTAHGELALPAPATTYLLRGFPMLDDGRKGERVTPTGAAIFKHLQPRFETLRSAMTLLDSGCGFGTKKLHDMSNVLRVLAFAPSAANGPDNTLVRQSIAVCEFEVDDQTPEDLAIGLEHIRALDAVLDVLQAPMLGKKGRMSIHVRVLAELAQVDSVIEHCLRQTTTIGVRWHQVQRTSLARQALQTQVGEQKLRVKQVTRPGAGAAITGKVEMDDLAMHAETHSEREQLRKAAEAALMKQDGTEHD